MFLHAFALPVPFSPLDIFASVCKNIKWDVFMIINRDFYLNKLISARQNNMVKVITGIRRCGKSFLLFNLFKEYLSQNGIDESHFIEIQFVILLLESTEMQKKHIIS